MTKKIAAIFTGLLVQIFLAGCQLLADGAGSSVQIEIPDFDEAKKSEAEYVTPVEVKDRLWNILIYMSADNNLEASAIEDLNEMELSDLDTETVSVFVLLDRSESYDNSNGNWAGTKLLKLSTGKSGEEKFITSEEIECKSLGLTPGKDTELDMSSPYTLADSLSYVRKRFPAEYYGLVIWGHGTGWRSGDSELDVQKTPGGYKGFAYDETSKTYMTLKQLGSALKAGLNGEQLDFLGFDTCFGCELEVMYELKDYALYSAGSEGLLQSSGWNYKDFFSSLQQSETKSPQILCEILMTQFSQWYENSPNASFCTVKMNKLSQYFQSFDKYMGAAAQLITSRTVRDQVIDLLYSQSKGVEKYTYGSANSDIYLDIHSLVENLDQLFNNVPYLKQFSKEYFDAESLVILDSWNSFNTQGGMGIYFQTLASDQVLSAMHPSAYIREKTLDQISFVAESLGYVPNLIGDESFLEQLFYTSF